MQNYQPPVMIVKPQPDQQLSQAKEEIKNKSKVYISLKLVSLDWVQQGVSGIWYFKFIIKTAA